MPVVIKPISSIGHNTSTVVAARRQGGNGMVSGSVSGSGAKFQHKKIELLFITDLTKLFSLEIILMVGS